MALVNYSDSEDSDSEQPKATPRSKPVVKAFAASSTNFSIDRANPQRIRVKLADSSTSDSVHEDEPAPKRPRVGGGGFEGFNSLLPAPQRDADVKTQSSMAKGPARKVFSLKTGAEPGFSRESDEALRSLFAEQDEERGSGRAYDEDVGMPDSLKQVSVFTVSAAQPAVRGNAFMFKPLSVARNPARKKKLVNGIAKTATPAEAFSASNTVAEQTARQPDPAPKKVSLFSMPDDKATEPSPSELIEEFDRDPLPADEAEDYPTTGVPVSATSHIPGSQNLDSIASDLNLSAAERRQLFGRNTKNSASAANISNFNMDQEYLANEELRATGEQVQHNPLRAIAPGKHSLKQLVSVAQGQKDALEESFATGRRNKKEAGNKYGW